MEERKSGNTVLLTVIGIATLLVAIVGATFAFFTANITNPVGSSIKIETATLEITFEDGDVIDLLSAHPGNIDGLGNEAVSKTFTVTNNTSYAAHYNLVWNKLEHNVVQANDEFQYSLTCTASANADAPEGTNAGTVPSGFDFKYPEGTYEDATSTYTGAADLVLKSDRDGADASFADVTIEGHTTHKCIMTFRFKEIGSEQNYNQGKHFYGQLKITPVATNN